MGYSGFQQIMTGSIVSRDSQFLAIFAAKTRGCMTGWFRWKPAASGCVGTGPDCGRAAWRAWRRDLSQNAICLHLKPHFLRGSAPVLCGRGWTLAAGGRFSHGKHHDLLNRISHTCSRVTFPAISTQCVVRILYVRIRPRQPDLLDNLTIRTP